MVTDDVPEPSETDFNEDSLNPVIVAELPQMALQSPVRMEEVALEDSSD